MKNRSPKANFDNPHLLRTSDGKRVPVEVLHKRKKISTIRYKGRIVDVDSSLLTKIKPDHLLPEA